MRYRDRHGRGMRGRLAPAALPLTRTRAQTFDETVLEAVEAIERHLANPAVASRVGEATLRGVEFAVEEVPGEPGSYDTDVVEDRGVPLARLLPAQPGTAGANPRIVLYRRPLELRATGPEELAVLIRGIVVEQIADLLGVPADDIDPDRD